jgi:hypothetical protein
MTTLVCAAANIPAQRLSENTILIRADCCRNIKTLSGTNIIFIKFLSIEIFYWIRLNFTALAPVVIGQPGTDNARLTVQP